MTDRLSKKTRKRKKGQCCLTQAGLNLIRSKIEALEPEYQSNSGLADWMGDGCNRETVGKILNCTEPVRYGSLSKLFSSLDIDLEEQHWKEWSDSSALPLSRGHSNPASSAPKKPSIDRVAQVADLLWSLNCEDQDAQFSRAPIRDTRTHVFVVRAKEIAIQKWLVKRFTRPYSTAKTYSFAVRSHRMRWNFDDIWEEFAAQLKLSAPSKKGVLEGLCEQARTQPVFIAAYGLQGYEDFRDRLLSEFWQPLTQQFCADSTRKSFRSQLLLFLTEAPPGSDPTNPDLCILPSLETITPDHVERWIGREDVLNSLSFLGEDCIERLVQEQIPTWSCCPAEVIDELCYAFQLTNGIAEIESYWKLEAV